MSKKTQGFTSQGGRGVAAKPTASYSPDELKALSRLDRDAVGVEQTALCDLCGKPIASQSSFERPEDRYSFFDQARRGRHIACDARRARLEQEKNDRQAALDREAYNALPASERERLEELEAAKFNESGGIDTRSTPLIRPKISLADIKKAGGVSRVLSDKPFELEEKDPEILRQTAEREAQLRADHEREQQELAEFLATEEQNKRKRSPKKAHDSE